MLSVAGGIILGLLVGSFLNVVIYRLPIMMEREWRQQCRELFGRDTGAESPEPADDGKFNLLWPRSRCSACGTMITALQNIPVISWLLLGGKCGSCGVPISARYPAIELLTGALSGLAIYCFGPTVAGGAALLIIWCLIALTFIDIDHQLLPDNITLPLMWAGIAFAAIFNGSHAPFPDLGTSVSGAMAGYLSLWTVYWAFKLITGKEGMGYGDFKLLAALGAWLGWQMLPLIIMLSAVVGAITGVAMIMILGRDRQIPIPFGPYLAGAGIIALFWGEQIVAAYLAYSKL